jgi:REP element-mobilizing transposase RayT
MSQSFSANYQHLVFSTKERIPCFRDKQLRSELHAYLGSVSEKLECHPIIVGGVEDHVHILAELSRTITPAEWVKELKRVSSLWVNNGRNGNEKFSWQSGYGVFSVSKSNLDVVIKYIATQEEHHRKTTFQDEFRKLLKRHDIEWEERYVWD